MAKRMHPNIRGRWVTALKHPHMNYKKGEGYLNRDGCMCAFGVLCDLYRRSHPNDGPLARWHDFGNGIMGFGDRDYIRGAPPYVLEWAGIPSDRINSWSHIVFQVTTRNDGTNGNSIHDFVQLAEYIEAYA